MAAICHIQQLAAVCRNMCHTTVRHWLCDIEQCVATCVTRECAMGYATSNSVSQHVSHSSAPWAMAHRAVRRSREQQCAIGYMRHRAVCRSREQQLCQSPIPDYISIATLLWSLPCSVQLQKLGQNFTKSYNYLYDYMLKLPCVLSNIYAYKEEIWHLFQLLCYDNILIDSCFVGAKLTK